MPCYHPLQAFSSKKKNAQGKSTIIFHKKLGSSSIEFEPIKLPCGRCIGCRLERSRQWAMRCLHESSLYSQNCFVTLTYNPQHLPENKSVSIRPLQLFIKRLRKKFGKGIRYFACGEYGQLCKTCGQGESLCYRQGCGPRKFIPSLGRPHYHLCIFNFDFPDKVRWKINNGNILYHSEMLNNLWSDPDNHSSFGFATIGDVTFESAAYVARYITKKITGEKAAEHYGEIRTIKYGPLLENESWWDVKPKITPEFITMSRRPGIGTDWFKKYPNDCYPKDFVTIRGVKMLPPKFYDKLLEKTDELLFTKIKQSRKTKQLLKYDPLEESPERRKTKEFLKRKSFKELKRSLENE